MSKAVVEVLEDLEFSYPQRPECRYIVPAGIVLRAGEAGCVLGVSGSGKSTVMTLLAGLRRFARGRIRFELADGHCLEVAAESWSRRIGPRHWGQIGFAFQRPEMIRSLTVAGNLALVARGGVRPVLFTDDEWQQVINARVWRLSGGQVQRLGLIRAFAGGPRLVFLDEPTNNLDRGNRDDVAAFVRQRRAGRALMVVSHDTSFVQALEVDRLFALEECRDGSGWTRTLTPAVRGAAAEQADQQAARSPVTAPANQ